MHTKELRKIWKKKEEDEIKTRVIKGTTTILDDINQAIAHLNIELKQTSLKDLKYKITKDEEKQRDVSTYFRFMQLFLKYIKKDDSISKFKVISDLETLSNVFKEIQRKTESLTGLKEELKVFHQYFLPLHLSKEDEIIPAILNPDIEEFWNIQALFCKIPTGFNGKLSEYPSGIDPTQVLLMDNFLQLFTGSDDFTSIDRVEVPQVKKKDVFGYRKKIGELQREKFQEILESIGFQFNKNYIYPDMKFWEKYRVYNQIDIEYVAGSPKNIFNFSDQTLYQVYLINILTRREFTSNLMTWFAIILAWLILLRYWFTKIPEGNLFENLFEEKFFSRMFICKFAKTVALAQFGLNNVNKIDCGELQMNNQVFDAATSHIIEFKTQISKFMEKEDELSDFDLSIIDRIEDIFLNDIFPLAENMNQTSFLKTLRRDCKRYFDSLKGESINAQELINELKPYLLAKTKEAIDNQYIDSKIGDKLLKTLDNLHY